MALIDKINHIRHYFERNGFGVFTRLAERLGIGTKNVRLFFLYATFFTFGISFVFYLIAAFILKIKDLIYTKRSSVFDL